MTNSLTPPLNRGGIPTALAVITSPKSAFAALRAVPTWGWAYLFAVVLAIVGAFLIQPAVLHVLTVSVPQQLAKNPAIARLPADQQQKQIAAAAGMLQTFGKLQWLSTPFGILIIGLLQAIGLLVIAKIGRSEATFKQFWAVAINITIVSVGLSSIVAGVIALIRGADSYGSSAELLASVPSLAWLVPDGPVKLVAFLAGLSNPFALWSTVLAVLALMVVGGLAQSGAIVGGVVLLVLGAAVGAAFVQ
jgi:hypothetical protein